MARATLLSPARYQRMGFGMALPSGYTVSQLRSALIRAQGLVTRYVGAPKMPQAFDWRGGTMTDERHQWNYVNPLAYGPGAKRVYLNTGPIKAVTSFILDLGKSYTVTLTPSTDLYVNPMEQYVEVVAIYPTVIGYYPLQVSLGLYVPVARVTYTYGWSFGVAGDVLEAESPTVYSAAYGNWDSTPAVIYLDGVEQLSGVSVDRDDGTVTFTTAPQPGVVVTADYTYTVPDAAVQAIGITATDILGKARLAARGMVGLQSLRVAEITLTQQPMATRNGVMIPADAAVLLDSLGIAFGKAA